MDPQDPTLNQAVAGLKAANTSFSTAGVASGFSSSQYVVNIPEYAVVDLLVTNYDDGGHPFHLHGHQFWVLASSPEQYFDWSMYHSLNATLPSVLKRDTIVIDAYGWVLIRTVGPSLPYQLAYGSRIVNAISIEKRHHDHLDAAG
ncbi:hypothetical protein LTR07_010773 [Exophiala xenobiotica]|nr:hypothetical protein LTR07_010773 [Exophiala xenobiotica]